MRTESVRIYEFDELDDSTKTRAIEDYRVHGIDHDWHEATIDMLAEIADWLGIDTRVRRVKLMNGNTRLDPAIGYSGFWSQGDGAHFEGTYEYSRGALKRIRTECPQDTELHRIASELQELQRPYFYSLCASVNHSGFYQHENCTIIDVYSDVRDVDADTVNEVQTLLRDFMRWMYRTLEREYEYQTSDEYISEIIRANEYEFYADGSMV